MTIALVEKGIPTWDGDGLQGAGQPRDRLGKWVRLPGTTALKKIGAWELDDGTFGVFKDGEEEPFKTFKTKKAANNLVAKLIKEDASAYFRDRVAPKERKKHAEYTKEKQEKEKQILAEQAAAAGRREKAPVLVPSGKEPAKGSRRFSTDETARLTLPSTPTADQQKKANEWARQNLPKEEAKYAELIARLAKKNVTQDPAKRGEMGAKYGISPKRLIEIEQEVYAQMFPVHSSRERRRDLGGGVVAITDQQKKAMLENGGLKAIVMAPADGSTVRPERMFKATKGPHRGKYVKVSWNGTAEPMDDDEAIDAIYEGKLFWAARLLSNKERMERMHDRKRKENAALREGVGESAAAQKAGKIAAAQRWAKEQGFDPSDSFWWGFFWNDASLVKGGRDQDDDIAEGTKALTIQLGEVMEHEKMDPKLLEGILALPDDISSRRMRGHRPGPKRAVEGDDDFVEASVESRATDEEWESRNKDRQVEHNRRIRMAYDRYKKKHPTSKLTIEEFTNNYYNAKLRIPGGAKGNVNKANALWDGDGVQGIGQPRGPHTGRWVKGGRGALSAVARSLDLGDTEVRLHTGSRPTRAGAAAGTGGKAVTPGAKKEAFSNGVLQEKLKRLPRSGKHVMVDAKGKPLQSKPMTPEQAITRRNVGPTAISNVRLKKIWEEWNNTGKRPPQKEFDLIVSAGGQNHIDGDKENIKTRLKSGAAVEKSRAQIFTMLRSQWAAGSGDRSHRREGIGTESRDKAKEKRRGAFKQNSAEQAKKRVELGKIFSENGKSCVCIFCGKPVSIGAMSLETIKPKEIGGDYTIGNMVPAHSNCNTKANKRAQADPAGYYKEQKASYKEKYSLSVKRRHTAAAKASPR